jgi:hypothetical protein
MPCSDGNATPSDYDKAYIDMLTRMLCHMVRGAHKHHVTYLMNEEVRGWWNNHKDSRGHQKDDL